MSKINRILKNTLTVGAFTSLSRGNARDRPCGSVGFVEKAA